MSLAFGDTLCEERTNGETCIASRHERARASRPPRLVQVFPARPPLAANARPVRDLAERGHAPADPRGHGPCVLHGLPREVPRRRDPGGGARGRSPRALERARLLAAGAAP